MYLLTLLWFLLCSSGASGPSQTSQLTSDPSHKSQLQLAQTLSGLSTSQKKLLYQYGTLQTYAGQPVADSFWQHHRQELPVIGQADAGILARELLNNTELVYTVKKPSRLQALRGVLTTSRMLLGLAALIAAYSLIHLLSRYWNKIFGWLYRLLRPVFDRLFSPLMVTWEMLLLSIAGIYWGAAIPDLVLRTIIIHVSLFTLWAQLTALLSRHYLIKYYFNEIKDCLDLRRPPGEAMLKVGLPALATTLAVVWLMFRLPEPWYAYEVIVPAQIALFTLPPMVYMHRILVRMLLPFPITVYRSERSMTVYAAIALLVWLVLVVLPPAQPPVLITLSVVVGCLLLFLSIEEVTRCGTRNFIWLQLITVGWLCACVLAGGQLSIPMLNWIGLYGLLVYVVIKYWEIPVLLGYSWKNRKALGSLGLAVIIWAIASLIRWQPQWFIWF
ncbi:hypothetical protein [Chitinophaga sp. HK235]|uniref:hypothetical protein n=1 Tax=Chitinophaga sp. HK235 TaxID=2952571 RepID=UPI001BA4D61D|nr:hypothetical protein [Chitinophaga sp. HK235]